MTTLEQEIILENRGGSYKISKVDAETGKEISYHGKVCYLLNNESRNFAVIYKKQIQALSGPPGEVDILLDAGVGHSHLSMKDLREKLEVLTHDNALLEADALAKKSGLKVREIK